MKRPKLWRVEGVGARRESEQVFVEAVYLEAYNETHARLRGEQIGLRVQTVTLVNRSDVPSDHAVLELDPSHGQLEMLRRIAASPLIRLPFFTIALAVFVGTLASLCLWSLMLHLSR